MVYSGSFNPVIHDGWRGLNTNYGNGNPDDPGVASPMYWSMSPQWQPVADVLSGTIGMRSLAGKYLPRLCNESDECWQSRINRSSLTPLFQRVVKAAVGLILRKPIYLDGGDEAYWEEWRQNVDRQESNLDEFMGNILYQAIAYGHCGFLTDFPPSDARTLRDEAEMAAKPYFIPQPAFNILGWRHDPAEAKGEITQVRLREQTTEPDGEFGTKVCRRVRVIEAGQYRIFKEKDLGSAIYELEDTGTYSLNEIPLSVVYSQREAVLMSRPPLLELAHLNIQHFTLEASLLNALHVSAFPLLTLKGWDDESNTLQNLTVGNALALPIDGDAEYVEPASSSFDAIQAELTSLSEHIGTLGISILAKQKNVQESGFSKQMDRADSNSMLAQISLNAERALQQALNWAAQYAGVQPPTVVIDRDFNADPLRGGDITPLTALYTNGVINQETLLKILQRGEILDDSADLDDILNATEMEQAGALEREVETAQAMADLEVARPERDDDE